MENDHEPRTVLAFHEAGHAVIALSMEIPIKEIFVAEDASKGYCKDMLPRRYPDRECPSIKDTAWAETKAKILLGGELAEWILSDEQAHIFCSDGDRNDLDELVQSLGWDPDDAITKKWIEARKEEAKSILLYHWDALESLAEELLKRNRVSGDYAKRIVQSRGKDRVDGQA